MKVSVIIPTKNRFDHLIRTVKSLLAQSVLPYEIIVVDDGSEKEIYDKNKTCLQNLMIESNKRRIFYLKGTEKGANSARNMGINKARGEIILFLDDDVILDKDYIKAILEVYLKYPFVGGVGGIIQNYPKTCLVERLFKKIFFLSQSSHNKAYLLPSGYPCHLESCNKITEVEVLSGCNMSYKKEVFRDFYFDENLKGYAYLDDVDFSYRVSRKYKLVITPNAKLIHNTIRKSTNEKYHEIKIYYHYLIFNKLLTKNARTIAAFYISLLGNFIQSTSASLVYRKIGPIKGFFKGILDIIHHEKL